MVIKLFGQKISQLSQTNSIKDTYVEQYKVTEVEKLSELMSRMLSRDGVAEHLLTYDILKVLSQSLNILIEMQDANIRNSLSRGCIIVLTNLLADDKANDHICDRLLKETNIVELAAQVIPFNFENYELCKYLQKDLAFLYSNLSVTDDPWCIN